MGTLADLRAQVAPSGAPPKKSGTLADLQKKVPPIKSDAQNVREVEAEYGGTAGTDFLKGAVKTAAKVGERIMLHPGTLDPKLAAGGAKAVFSGAVSLAELLGQSVAGVGYMAKDSARKYAQKGLSAITLEGLREDYLKGQEKAVSVEQKIRDYSAAVTKINTAPINKEDEAMSELLGLLPGGAHATGETVYEKTGSAFLGAGTEALMNLFMFKPGIAGKVMRTVTPSKFRELAATDPKAADELADHVKPADPKLAEEMKSKVKQVKKAKAKGADVFKELGQEEVNKDTGKSLPEKWDFLEEEEKKANVITGKSRDQLSEDELRSRESRSWSVKYKNAENLYPPLPANDPANRGPLRQLYADLLPTLQRLQASMDATSVGTTLKGPIAKNYGIKATDLLDILAKASSTKEGTILFRRLASAMPDETRVQPLPPGHSVLKKPGGHFDPKTNNIRITFSPNMLKEPQIVSTLIHELSHATTYRFLRDNPTHPYTKEIRSALAELKARVRRMSADPDYAANSLMMKDDLKKIYGIANPHEFLSETLANPNFAKFLNVSEKYASAGWKAKRITTLITSVVKKVLGIKDLETSRLLDTVLGIHDDIIELRAKAKAQGHNLGGHLYFSPNLAPIVDDLQSRREIRDGKTVGSFVDQMKGRAPMSKDLKDRLERQATRKAKEDLGPPPTYPHTKGRGPSVSQWLEGLSVYDRANWKYQNGKELSAQETKVLEDALNGEYSSSDQARADTLHNTKVDYVKGYNGRYNVYMNDSKSSVQLRNFATEEEAKSFARTAEVAMRASLDKLHKESGHWTWGAERLAEESMARLNKAEAASPQKLSAGVSTSAAEMSDAITANEPVAPTVDGTEVYKQGGLPVTRGDIKKMFKIGLDEARKIPKFRMAEAKLTAYVQEIAHTVAVETLGDKAKLAAAIVTKAITKAKAWDAQLEGMSEKRRAFWNYNSHAIADFLEGYETGKTFTDPSMETAARGYRAWMSSIYQKDKAMKISYEPEDNYITHIFEDPTKVADFLKRKYGAKWGDPYFMKDRVAKTYKELIEAGYKPKYTNPEDIMMHRAHASNIAHARIEMLNDLAQQGLAVKVKTKAGTREALPPPNGWGDKTWRSPNDQRYYVHPEANAILHNAFETKSLWTDEGIRGGVYRGLMAVKNKIVPIRLFGLYHAMHVGLLINNAAALTRASKMFLSGAIDPKMFAKDLATGLTPLSGLWDSTAHRILKAYWGKIPESQLTDVDRQTLMYMQEGGLVPGMSAQDRGSAVRKFKDAIQQGKNLQAAWHLPFMVIDSLQGLMFKVWIPTLKIAAYTRDVATALHVDPTLVSDPARRQLALRKIAKSVDNRFGEMSYDTLFWNRTVKDLAVLNTLSLGWQMGFIREYGGGIVEIGRGLAEEGKIQEKAKRGNLDRALFASYYMGGALLLGGFMSWALSGQPPQGLDFFYPRTGEKDADGKPKRVNTPFYTREFASIAKHMENEGVMPGLGHLVTSKASGVIGLTMETAIGVNSLGQEIRDPNAPLYKKLAQTLAYEFRDIEPISAESYRAGETKKGTTLAALGFSPAPQYATQTKLQGQVQSTFLKYYGQKQTPYEKAEYSREAKELRNAAGQEDEKKYDEILQKMKDKYDLSPAETKRLESSILRGEDRFVKMFSRLTWQQQKHILDENWDSMTDDEKEEFLKHSNKEHLRYDYEGPGK